MNELFLICALALPPAHFHHAPAVAWCESEKAERDRLIDWIKKINPEAEVFIHPNPQREKLKEHGWERLTFNWRWQEIWIQRKPRHDRGAA